MARHLLGGTTLKNTRCKYASYELPLLAYFQKDHSPVYSKSGGTSSSFNIAPSVQVHIFSQTQNSSQVHHNTLLAAHFSGLCVPTGFFCMTLQVDVVVSPTYFVK